MSTGDRPSGGTDKIRSPSLHHLRHLLERVERAALDRWNTTCRLKRDESSDEIVDLMLRFMTDVAAAMSEWAGAKVDSECFRWIACGTQHDRGKLTAVPRTGNRAPCGTRRVLRPSGDKYGVLTSGTAAQKNEKRLLLRAWIPDLRADEEVILVVQFRTKDWMLTREQGPVIETRYETLLSGIRLSLYQFEQGAFVARARFGVPDRKLADSGERLLYREMWHWCWKEGRNIDLEQWLGPKSKAVEFNSCDQDYVLAGYLTSLLYMVNRGDAGSRERLVQAMKETGAAPIRIHLSRGPAITLGAGMNRTLCVVAEAKAMLENPSSDILMSMKDRLLEETAPVSGLPPDQRARGLRALCAIVGAEAAAMAGSKSPLTGDGATQLVEAAHQIGRRVQPLLKRAFQGSEGWIELSSRWLDAWFGLRLIESEVLPRRNVDHCEASRLAALVRCWVCYLSYLLDYFVMRRPGTAASSDLPELPTHPADGAVEEARLALLCEWAHERGVPRAIPLHAWLSRTYESELALYALAGKEGRHRQHLFHVQDECLLGCALLESHWSDGTETEGETYVERLARVSGLQPPRLRCNWLAAALLHDLGYALQVIPRGLEALPEGVVGARAELAEDFRGRLTQLAGAVADYDPTPTRASGQLELADHAHISMAALLSHLRSLCDQWQTASEYNPAAAAIIEHGSKDTPVDYATDPLSALIVVCDQLQEWGRPRLDGSRLARGFLGSLMRAAPGEKADQDWMKQLSASSLLFVKIKRLDDNCNLVHPMSGTVPVMQFLVHGPCAGDGGYEPAVGWLDVCRAFQRIRPPAGDLLPEISVTLQHSVARDGMPELHRLSRFAHDNAEQRGAILDWLDYVREQDIIRYGCGKHMYDAFSCDEVVLPDPKPDRYEWIEYIVPHLNHNEDRLLKALPDKLYKSYREFRQKPIGMKEL